MSFVYPAGLWALLALGVFAAVCLIRHRSEVTPVSSTYLWRLSEQRRKKKGYWRTLKRSLFFALQFLALALSALLIAQPIMPMPGSGVNVAVMTDGPVTAINVLLYEIGEAVRKGMDPVRALGMVTVNAARILGIEDRVGSLAVGMDADILVWSALPSLAADAVLERVIIDGKTVFEVTK